VGTSTKNRHTSISIADAEKAIYVDFEGFQDQPPSLLGILVDGTLTQVVLDPRLTAAAAAKGCMTAAISDVAASLKRWCRDSGRKLVGYSQHELRVFAEYTGVDFTAEYRDARMIAKRWWNKCRPDAPRRDNGLKAFLEAIGRPHPAYFGEQKATSRLRAVIDMLGNRRTYKSLTPIVKSKWQMLLKYNEQDCRGMQTLVTISCAELASDRA